jgi:RNA 3'-terminal phosphate cyclase (ATP)
MINIDGSIGEGGGQILRTSLALSMCTGKPFCLQNLRAKRPKPGLLRQHLTAVQAAAAICGGEVLGAEIFAPEVMFVPGPVRAGNWKFSIGTAGSATLVLQTVLPALLGAASPSTVTLEGGTHNPFSPPFHFIARVFLPLLKMMGVESTAEISQWGFYPAGGGKVSFTLTPPAAGLKQVDLSERGELVRADILTAVAKIPFSIAEDEKEQIVHSVRFPITEAKAIEAPSIGPGNVAMLACEFANSRALFTAFGQMGVSRKKVAHEVSSAANRLYKTGVAVDEHLADQLLIPMALAGGGRFSTIAPTPHTTTNIEIIRRFLDIDIRCEPGDRNRWLITLQR